MTDELRQDSVETPEGRLAAIAHALLARYLDNFRDEIALFAKREILVAQIETTKKFGTFPEAMKLQRELDKVNFEIAKRHTAP